MAYSIFDVIKDTLSGTVKKTSSELSKERIAICNICPENNKTFNICQRCGCYIPNKVKYEQSTCPLNKW
jgi:hypothetical protein